MKQIHIHRGYVLDIIDEKDKPIDIFESKIVPSFDECEDEHPTFVYYRKPNFGRFPTFEEDLIDFRNKWHGKPQEVLVQHMIDSLIIFNHNMGNLIGTNFKIKRIAELMKTK